MFHVPDFIDGRFLYTVYYVNYVDCETAVAAFKNSKKWAGYSAI